MSLQALPSELDTVILSHLNMRDKCHMTMVSKYYRRIGEPLLYERVCLWTDEDDRIKHLLLTLLQRDDLRPFVKQFRLRQQVGVSPEPLPQLTDRIRYRGDPDGAQLSESIWAQAPTIRNLLADLSSRYDVSAEFRMIWFAKVLELFPLFDGALSLLLCLITKVSDITLEFSSDQPIPITLEILGAIEWNVAQDDDQDEPFRHLKSLCVTDTGLRKCSYPLRISPGLRHLFIKGNCDPYLYWPHEPPVGTNTLRMLSLYDVDIDPQYLLDALRSSWLSNLEDLTLNGVGCGDPLNEQERPWLSFDYSLLKQAMLEHLPKLKCFICLDMVSYLSDTPDLISFGSFGAFSQLRILSIDLDLLLSREYLQTFEDGTTDMNALSGYFLQTLEVLDIGQLEWFVVEGMFIAYLALCDDEPRAGDEIQQSLAALPVKTIRFSINLFGWYQPEGPSAPPECWIDEPAVHVLRDMADALHSLGTTLEVSYQMDQAGRRRPLVLPGFTAEAVYFDDYEDRRNEAIRDEVADDASESDNHDGSQD
tara:strand:+ start:1685 stop:3289 length:1605 start_codon:yes stop_codon:yes gene_type:complete